MWSYDEFIAKAKLYFSRAKDLDHDDDAFGIWLMLGLEFLLRAPLAKVHPALLAVPEGDSVLHAVGIVKKDSRPRSVVTKTVVDRLSHVHPDFGQDRAKDALFLADLRNAELHTSEASVRNASIEVWLPKLLAVVEAVCSSLQTPVTDFLSSEIVDQATAYREEADASVRKTVREALKNAQYFYSKLTADEISQRRAGAVLRVPLMGRRHQAHECPGCLSHSADLVLASPRTVSTAYDEDTEEIESKLVFLAESLSCPLCGLNLTTTAEVMAAGVPRLHTVVVREDRYEGWEDRVSYDGDDYGND